jgi:hypothetical protein
LIAKPPQIQTTNFEPNKGIAVNKLVITVDPQKLICPHGNVYPKKEIPAIKINNTAPEHHTHCLGLR